MSIYESAVKRPIMTSLCFMAIALFGIFSFSKLPIDLMPDIETNTIMVFTYYNGASAEDIENNVTRPLENTLNSVEHLKHITSNSRENVSVITLQFEYGYDIDDLTNEVRDKLDMVASALPSDANNPIIFKFSTDMIPIMMLSATAETKESQEALYKILDENVVNPLARIDGVGTVSISGAPEREINVYMDPNQMLHYNISIEAVSAAIGAENRNIPGGTIDVGSNTIAVRVEGEFKEAIELDSIIVKNDGDKNVYLYQVATIVDNVQERAQETYTNGQKGAMIIIQKQSGSNSVAIAQEIREVLPELQKRLPSDVKLDIIADTSENILQTVDTLSNTILDALMFVVLVVFIFLGRWRATVIVAITIPFSLIASLIYLYASGGSINMISLSCLSIAIGSVVDDAIVVLENVTTHIERGSSPQNAAIHGTNEVAVSVVASTLTMLAVFFPLTMVTGMAGVLFKQLGWMMCIIMIVSTVAALTLIPVMCANMLKLQKKQSKLFLMVYKPIQKGLDAIDNGYAAIINWAVRHRWIVLICCFGLFMLSLLCAKNIKSEFFPSNDSARASAKIELKVGTRIEEAREIALSLTNKWKERYGDDMRACNFTVGQASENNTYASLSDNGTHIISFNFSFVPSDQREITMDEICDQMRADIRDIPAIAKSNITSGQQGMGGQSMASFEIYGHDFEETDKLAQALADSLRKSDIISQVNISRSAYLEHYCIEFNREKLAKHGMNLSTAATYIRNSINGAQATYFREDGDEYDVKVRYKPEFRQDIDSIRNILLPTATGMIKANEVIDSIVMGDMPPTIERKDRSRIVTVNAVMAAGAALSDGVAYGEKVIKSLEDNGQVPSGVAIQVAGSYEDQQESNRDLGQLGIIIFLLVFIVMASQFESLTYPFIIMFSVVFAFSGVLLALFFTDSNLNIMSMLGGIMLIGMVVKNGIVLIDYTMLLRERGYGIIASCVGAAKSRLRPVLMTTLTTILGMIPMATSQGVGAEMWRPLGIAVIGGLTISTIMTMIYVPAMYSIFAAFGVKRKRKNMKKQRELNAYWKEHKAEEQLKHKDK